MPRVAWRQPLDAAIGGDRQGDQSDRASGLLGVELVGPGSGARTVLDLDDELTEQPASERQYFWRSHQRQQIAVAAIVIDLVARCDELGGSNRGMCRHPVIHVDTRLVALDRALDDWRGAVLKSAYRWSRCWDSHAAGQAPRPTRRPYAPTRTRAPA